MAPIDIIIQETLPILSNPAWSGIGVIVSSALSLVAFRNSQDPPTHLTQRAF